jgi:L-lactate dehydrogenase (cytochrome)
MGRDAHWQARGYSIAAMRELARRSLPRPVFDFADGGAEDEKTLGRNESAFDHLQLLPRPLNGSPARDLGIELFGRRLSLPVVVGPAGCGAAPRWMQVFIYKDRGFTEELVRRSAVASFDALVLTIDNQMLGKRERDIRNGFTIPPRFTLRDALAMAGRLPWLGRMRAELPRITFGNYVRPGEASDVASLAQRMASLLDPSMSWSDVDWLRSIWKGPLILKGVLHPADAAEAASRGVDAVIVSNHGGRQLDGAVAAVEALPGVVRAANGRIPVLMDGGIRRGSDVVKALALGARCCLVGRPQLWGLAVGGQAGVAHVLEIFRREIDRSMGLLGVTRIEHLTDEYLFTPHAGGSRA